MIECFSQNELRVEDVQVNCKCGSKAAIQSRQQRSDDVADLYCSCKNPHCGHTFVMTLSFKSTLSPSANMGRAMLLDLFGHMDKQAQQEFINQARQC